MSSRRARASAIGGTSCHECCRESTLRRRHTNPHTTGGVAKERRFTRCAATFGPLEAAPCGLDCSFMPSRVATQSAAMTVWRQSTSTCWASDASACAGWRRLRCEWGVGVLSGGRRAGGAGHVTVGNRHARRLAVGGASCGQRLRPWAASWRPKRSGCWAALGASDLAGRARTYRQLRGRRHDGRRSAQNFHDERGEVDLGVGSRGCSV